MSPKTSIFHIFPTLASVAGAENALLRQIQADTANEHHLVCNRRISRQTRTLFIEAGATVHPLCTFQVLKFVPAFLAVRRCVSGSGPEVLVGWMYLGAIWASLVVMFQRRRMPLIWSLHHSFESLKDVKTTTWFTIRGCRLLVRLPLFIAYVSHYACQAHENIGYPKQKSRVIYNPIVRPDHDGDVRPLTRTATIHIGMAARWDATKDHATLIAAIGRLCATSAERKWVLHLCGTGMTVENEQLSLLIADSGLRIGTDVLLYGHLQDMQAFYVKLTIYVQSSRREAFGMAAAEAMAAGVPSIASNVGGLPEVIGDRDCLFIPGDAASLTAALLWLSEPETFIRVAQAALLRAHQLFSTNTTISAYQALYQHARRSHA